jgi:uncharacterized SAM-dependent methyltransferase
MKIEKQPKLNTHHGILDDLTKDAVAMLTEQMQGHMERWEYSPSMFPYDPAGGGDHWADLVKNPGQYYLTEGDTTAIQWAVNQPKFIQAVSSIERVIELGPGSHEAILKKTIPFLKTCPKLKNYLAVDATVEQAADAARTVHENLSISTGIRGQNYINSPLAPVDERKTAIVMWGSSLGNIDGFANEDPFLKLVRMIENFNAGLKSADIMILCFDTESDEERVLRAYSEPSLRAQVLSVVHLLKRDGYVTGRFDPKLWHHEPVWFAKVGQCAHTIYPLSDQVLNIAGLTIRIPAWRRFISNNSYKFSPTTVESAAKCAGLNTVACLQNGPIALLIAEKY